MIFINDFEHMKKNHFSYNNLWIVFVLKPYVKPSAKKKIVYFIILIIYLKNSLKVRKCLGKIRKITHKNYFK